LVERDEPVGRLIALVVFESFSGRPVLGFADMAQASSSTSRRSPMTGFRRPVRASR
jgi:hypothetical protein